MKGSSPLEITWSFEQREAAKAQSLKKYLKVYLPSSQPFFWFVNWDFMDFYLDLVAGWESQLLEPGFLAIFLFSDLKLAPSGQAGSRLQPPLRKQVAPSHQTLM